ncbi:MAG: ABC transporter ATP-binding protein [Deltaproteobacteria bacterium]|jgi:branched-chain amino acid transport system ATP-binding protein|nr:ABC transporter ATP-binding protein [Deltaproteobacteria bacterium]
MTAILEVKEIITRYGQSQVLHGVSLEVGEGEVVALLGRNGVGKTTTFRSIMGLTPPRSGSIRLKGVELGGKKSYEIARLGVGYVPDDRRIFPDLTAEENLEMARRLAKKSGGPWTLARVYQTFPVLEGLKASKGTTLSGGEQKMLAIGRGLMKNPEILLLDEPSEGLAPLVVRNLTEIILQIQKSGVTLLLADQNIKFCRKVAGRGYIMEKGLIQYKGTMDEIWQNEEIVRKYLAV